MLRIVPTCVVGCLLWAFTGQAVRAESERSVRPDDGSLTDLPGRVEQLIQQLGANEFSRRQRAEAELRGLGLLSLDQLLAAQLNENPEISLAARHLVGQLSLNWVLPGDPAIISFVLKDYQRQPLSERLTRIEWLAKLEDGLGIDSICRIVRYERSEVLAKQAALQLMEFMDLGQEDQRQLAAASITSTLGSSPRRPADWLRTFQREPDDPRAALTAWQQWVDKELQLEPPQTSDEIMASLLRWHADRALALSQTDAARQSLSRLIAAEREESVKVLAIGHWLLDRQQWSLYDDLIVKAFPEFVSEDPRYTYGEAEIAFRQNQRELADELAEKAFAMASADNQNDPVDRIWLAYQSATNLETRGLIDWAIREYQRIAAMDTPDWRMEPIKERAIRLLAELLHDRQRDKEAADVLDELLSRSRTFRFSRRGYENDWAGVMSRMHFFRAEQYRQEGDREQQTSHLRQGLEADPTDADVLIAMYRLPRADDEWMDDTRRAIRRAVNVFEARLQRLQGGGVVDNRFEIATELNQLAWLVGNTAGDYAKAVAQSRRSLELRPRAAGFLDTLGRTYFAAGDVEKALKYQRRAVQLEPHTQQIRRQLLEFEQAFSASRRQDNS